MTVMVKNFTLLTKALRPLPQPRTDENGVTHDAFNDPELKIQTALCRFDGESSCKRNFRKKENQIVQCNA